MAALLLPSLSKAKAAALRVACASNLRQIGVALRLYVDDFQRYPAFNVLLSSTSRSNFWDNKLLPFAGGNQGLFLCPANTAVKGNVSSNWCFDDPTDQLCPNRPNRSYGYNAMGTIGNPIFLGGAYHYLGLGWPLCSSTPSVPYLLESEVVVPAVMIAVADYDPQATDYDNDGSLDPVLLYPVPNFPGKMVGGLTGRLTAGANALFCASSGMFRQFFIERDKGPIHPNGRRCPT